MKIKIGTFNLNNLFSRFNFQGALSEIRKGHDIVDNEIEYTFHNSELYRIKTFKGKLILPKKEKDTQIIADRILTMDLDILAVQEVEDIDTLIAFNNNHLNSLYKHVTLVEGNDKRLIDLGVLSKFPFGGVTSWKHAVDPANPDLNVFGRDLLMVDIYDQARSETLFTIFNNHMKSHFVPPEKDKAAGAKEADDLRLRQAKVMVEIVKNSIPPDRNFIILGDLNDPPEAKSLRPLKNSAEIKIVNGLSSPVITPSPQNFKTEKQAWSYRFKPTNLPAEYHLYDQIWLSEALSAKQTGSYILRRTKSITGKSDGSDHDPVWVELDL